MYQTNDILGTGTYGKVYAGSELVTRRKFAVKRLLLDEQSRSNYIVSLRELDMMARLSHPNVMPLTTVLQTMPRSPVSGFVDDQIELVMPQANNTLSQFLAINKDLAIRKKLLWQLLSGLHYIHQHQIIHRDLKPQNLLMFDSNIKISDFGLAVVYLPNEPRTPQMVTLWYRAPEILLGGDYHLSSDVWSLGCIFAEIITGRALFPQQDEENMIDHIFTALKPSSEHVSKITRRKRVCAPLPQLSEPLALLHKEIALTSSQVSEFNRSSGSYIQFLDLVNRMLQIDVTSRSNCATLLQHEFFDEYRTSLALTIQPNPTPHILRFHPLRSIGIELIDQQQYGIQYRVKFLAVDLLDRILEAHPDIPRDEIRPITFVALYLAEKYWLGERSLGLLDLTIDDPDEILGYQEREQWVLKDLLHYKIYRPTLYDYLPPGAKPRDIGRAFHLIRYALPFDGLRLDYFSILYQWVVKNYYRDWPTLLTIEFPLIR